MKYCKSTAVPVPIFVRVMQYQYQYLEKMVQVMQYSTITWQKVLQYYCSTSTSTSITSLAVREAQILMGTLLQHPGFEFPV